MAACQARTRTVRQTDLQRQFRAALRLSARSGTIRNGRFLGEMTAMRFLLLGSGCVRPDLERWGPCQALEVGGEWLIFDCGRGATMRMVKAGISIREVRRLFFTHHHYDHNCDFAYGPGGARGLRRRKPDRGDRPHRNHGMTRNPRARHSSMNRDWKPRATCTWASAPCPASRSFRRGPGRGSSAGPTRG